MKSGAVLLALLVSAYLACAGTVQEYADKIAPLIDPAKLATLGARGANPRVHKVVYWLATAKRDKVDPFAVATLALKPIAVTNSLAADLTKTTMLRNLRTAEKLGCLDGKGLSDLRNGKAATIRQGQYAGQELSVDHIIPRSVVPELDNVIANLELLPLKLNQSKNSHIGENQRILAEQFFKAGLLSERGLKVVRAHQAKKQGN